jgi:DNA (cytosine-5)-methyltransferase 1
MRLNKDNYTMPLGFPHELLIDNFAGGGGASEAIFNALGRHPDIAINHDGEALLMHTANHPTTKHYKEDVFLIHPGFVTQQQPIGLAWFSPTCTHFSKAKGGNLLNQKTRGLAWVTLKWAALQVPRTIFLENVEEFQGWGPLDNGGRPVKEHKGRTFDAFVKAMSTGIPKDHPDLQEIHETLGADFPIERLHIGLGYQVEWRILRACDYGAPTIRKRLFMVMRRDGLSIVWPSPTHGDPKSEAVISGKLKPWLTAAACIDWSIPCPSIFDRVENKRKELKDATLRRVGKGLKKYVIDAASPFIVDCAHSEESPTGVKRWGSGVRDINAPLQTVLAGGNGAAVVVPHITKFNTGSIGHGADEPLATITSGGGSARPAGAPHGLGVVTASLVQYCSGEEHTRSVNAAIPPLATKDRVGVQCAYLAKHFKGVVGASVESPMPTVTTVDHNSLITASLIGIDNRSSGDSAAWDSKSPLTTITTENRHALVTSHLAKLRGTSNAADTGAPLATISAGGQHHAEIRTTFSSEATDNIKRQKIREFLWKFCPGLSENPQPELVVINDEVMEIIDIGLRMLTPRELATAQGFHLSYILDPEYTFLNKRGKSITKRLSKSAQVRMIGNSVSPMPAAELIKANFGHELKLARVA